MSAIPLPDPDAKGERIILQGDVPSPTAPPGGCPFHPRCLYAGAACRTEIPEYREIEPGHSVACHLAEQLQLRPMQGS